MKPSPKRAVILARARDQGNLYAEFIVRQHLSSGTKKGARRKIHFYDGGPGTPSHTAKQAFVETAIRLLGVESQTLGKLFEIVLLPTKRSGKGVR